MWSLSNRIFEVTTKQAKFTIPFVNIDNHVMYNKALILYKELSFLPQYIQDPQKEIHKITLVESTGSQGHPSDSDDLPYMNPYTAPEMAIINYLYEKEVVYHYRVAMAAGLYNATGKEFVRALGNFLKQCCDAGTHRCLISTATKGTAQPGTFWLRWLTPSRSTRAGTAPIITEEVGYADVVNYERASMLNKIVYEIKEDIESPSENQHLKQMFGLWTPSQTVMLGFEFKDTIAIPKIILREKNCLNVFIFDTLELDNGSDLENLGKLCIAAMCFAAQDCHSTTSP